jgi:transcriptional regulator with XRE-family HTH domain
MNTFGQVVKALRKEAGQTLEALAKKIGSHKGYISGIENGKVNPPAVKVVRRYYGAFAKQLAGIATVEDLVELAEVDKAPPLIRDRMRRRIADNPLLTAAIVEGSISFHKPAAPASAAAAGQPSTEPATAAV